MSKIIFSKQGKKYFQVFLIVLVSWTSITCQLNLYNTDRKSRGNQLEYDCLDYQVFREKLAYQELSDVVDEIISYCFRPVNNIDELPDVSMDPLSTELSFEQIRSGSITVQQLFLWSIPVEVAERYQLYLNNPNSELNEYFYNCTPPRFGLRCQYSFEFSDSMSFDEIVKADFQARTSYEKSTGMPIRAPCYVLMECHRYGQPWCLDWREICNGKIECFDEGFDEEFCFGMEVNECQDDEYRCHNGLCISEDLWEDGMGDADCLDQSDRIIDKPYTESCYRDPTFRCEEPNLQ